MKNNLSFNEKPNRSIGHITCEKPSEKLEKLGLGYWLGKETNKMYLCVDHEWYEKLYDIEE
jgi:hypothetical protein